MKLQNYLAISAFVLLASFAQGQRYAYETLDFPGAEQTFLNDINNLGAVVGSYGAAEDEFGQSFIWSDGEFTTIEIDELDDAELAAINDAGVITGIGFSRDGFSANAFTLENGVVSEFRFPGAFATFPASISESGTIIGSYFDFVGETAGIFTKVGDSITEVPLDEETVAIFATGNDAGSIVGYGFSDEGEEAWVSFLIRDGVFETFSHPDGDTELYGINNLDEIIGHVYIDDDVANSFVYSGGEFHDVQFPDADTTEVYGINDHGVLLGTYYSADSDDVHGFIARPVPEPSASPLLLSGLLMLVCRRRSRTSRGTTLSTTE